MSSFVSTTTTTTTTSLAVRKFFESDVCVNLIPFLEAIELFQIYQFINLYTSLYLKRYLVNLSDSERENGCLIEKSGRPFHALLSNGRIATHVLSLANISPQGEKVLRETGNLSYFYTSPRLMNDLHSLNIAMYTNWRYTPSDSKSGVWHYLWKAFEHAESEKSLAKTLTDVDFDLKVGLLRDAQYWDKSHVFDEFLVLFDRPDGSVVVSSDYSKVYLVMGIRKTIGQMSFVKYSNSTGFQPKPAFKTPRLHSPLIGVRSAAILLNWENKIVLDGLIMPTEIPSAESIKRAIAAYLKAIETNTLIKVLQKRGGCAYNEDGTKQDRSSKQLEVDRMKLKLQLDLEYIRGKVGGVRNAPSSSSSSSNNGKKNKKSGSSAEDIPGRTPSTSRLPRDKEGIAHALKRPWIFRREGYTEKENPDHALFIMIGSSALDRYTFNALVPTPEEYVRILKEALSGDLTPCGGPPTSISIDAEESLEMLSDILEETGLYVSFYPPPTKAERFVSDLTNPYLENNCRVCRASHRSTGQKLLTCSQCKQVKYCCAEHQKADWKKHKKDCTAYAAMLAGGPGAAGGPGLAGAGGMPGMGGLDMMQMMQMMGMGGMGGLGGMNI
jgi:hypothetical protein